MEKVVILNNQNSAVMLSDIFHRKRKYMTVIKIFKCQFLDFIQELTCTA